MSTDTQRAAFSDRVVLLFSTHVVTTGVGFFNALLFARLLGPAAKGEYYLLVLPPATIMVLVQLGLPQAFGYFAAKGYTAGLIQKSIVLAGVLSAAALAVTLLALPVLRQELLRGLDPVLIVLALTALPLLLHATFTTAILIARGAVRWYSMFNAAQSIVAGIFLAVMIGVLGLGVPGAIIALLLHAALQAVFFGIGAYRARTSEPKRVSYRELLRYGLPLYPGSVTLFFGYRADVYLLAALLADPTAPLGYYSMAVTLAEMVFFFPNSVSALFFPRVAGSAREDADAQVPRVSRVTLLLTALVALAIAPAATLLIHILLPAFVPALPSLYVLLPGVVALSVNKVVSGYVSGLGMNAICSVVNIGAFVVNLALNVVLIPQYGILGAALASLISYTASSIAFTLVAARIAHATSISFWVPRTEDVRITLATLFELARRMVGRVTSIGARGRLRPSDGPSADG